MLAINYNYTRSSTFALFNAPPWRTFADGDCSMSRLLPALAGMHRDLPVMQPNRGSFFKLRAWLAFCPCAAEFGMRMERDRCWCQNARCRAITCEGGPQQGEHSCFTQVKLKRDADGSNYIKVKRGCTVDCKAYSSAEAVQQCCNYTLCNTGELNITHDNHTILSVEQLLKRNDSIGQFVNISDVAKIFSDIPTFPATTSAAPTTSEEDSEYPSLHSMSALTLVLQWQAQLHACMHMNKHATRCYI